MTDTPRPRLASQGAGFGAYTKRKKWRSHIYIDGRDVHLGYFATQDEAREAHAEAAVQHGIQLKELATQWQKPKRSN